MYCYLTTRLVTTIDYNLPNFYSNLNCCTVGTQYNHLYTGGTKTFDSYNTFHLNIFLKKSPFLDKLSDN